MTDRQALKQARKLFGPHGLVDRRTGVGIILTHIVGKLTLWMFFEVMGQGRTWEEAFADYEERKTYK